MADTFQSQSPSSSLWSIPLLCVGLTLVAICVLVPALESNRKLAVDREALGRELAHVDAQLAVNDEFLQHAKDDPELAERLAQRQMQQVRAGVNVLEVQGRPIQTGGSPFQILAVAPPDPVRPYHAPPGMLGTICQDTHQQFYTIGIGLLLVATSLVLGTSRP